jgi:ATP-dependent Lhr-like helicase
LELAEDVAWVLLRRYGVVFKRLLEREGISIPWRVLLRVYHRLEARGEIRGGRFVAGISGEQFALPEAVGMLRSIRREGAQESMISVSAADPLNLAGIITPGTRITAHTGNRVLYHDGAPIAALESGETRFLVELTRAVEWQAKAALVRKATRPELRSYLRRPA